MLSSLLQYCRHNFISPTDLNSSNIFIVHWGLDWQLPFQTVPGPSWQLEMLPGLTTPALLKIPSICLTWDWTGALSLNIPDYLIVLTLTKVHTGHFFFSVPIFGLNNWLQKYSNWNLLLCWLRGIRVLSCVFWSLNSWRSWLRVGDKRSEDTTTFDAFLNMSQTYACFTNEAFSCKNENLWPWDNSLPVPEYQDLQMIRCQIEKKLCCCCCCY